MAREMFYSPVRRDPYYIEEIEVKFPLSDEASFKAIMDKLETAFDGPLPRGGQALNF